MTIAVQHKHAASLTQQGTNLKPAAQYKYTKPVSHNRETTLTTVAHTTPVSHNRETTLTTAAQYKCTPVSHNRETTLKPAAQHKLSHTATLVRSHGV